MILRVLLDQRLAGVRERVIRHEAKPHHV